MKKTVWIALTLAMLAALAACSGNKAPTVTPSPSQSAAPGTGGAEDRWDTGLDGLGDDGTDRDHADDQGLLGEMEDGVGDVADGIGEAVDDAARGIGNAARDMTR